MRDRARESSCLPHLLPPPVERDNGLDMPTGHFEMPDAFPVGSGRGEGDPKGMLPGAPRPAPV